MTRPKHIAACSGGKDSVATILLAAKHNEPLDEIVFSEVMFDKETTGEVPEHRDFIYDKLKPFCENELGVKFTILHAPKTYDDIFHHIIVRGPHKGEKRGFVWAGMCAANRECKVNPMQKYNKSLSPDTVSYVGIAVDEPNALQGWKEHRRSACLISTVTPKPMRSSSVLTMISCHRSTNIAGEMAAGSAPMQETPSCVT